MTDVYSECFERKKDVRCKSDVRGQIREFEIK